MTSVSFWCQTDPNTSNKLATEYQIRVDESESEFLVSWLRAWILRTENAVRHMRYG